jgi:SAM-dependent methyltransferase
MRIDIGGGLVTHEGFTNLDPIHGQGVMQRRIQDGIPYEHDSVEAARCSHLMEHVPAGPERIAAFNEVWRVLEPGGTFEVIVPLFPCWGAIADPTHVSFWVRESFDYFTGVMVPNAEYGIRLWEMVEWTTCEAPWGTEGHAVLRKPR